MDRFRSILREFRSMDRKALGKILQSIREKRFDNRAAFTRKTGIKFPQIRDTENGDSWLRLDLLDKWVKACGWTLVRVFRQLEADELAKHGVPTRAQTPAEELQERFKDFASRDPEAGFVLMEMVEKLEKRQPKSEHKQH